MVIVCPVILQLIWFLGWRRCTLLYAKCVYSWSLSYWNLNCKKTLFSYTRFEEIKGTGEEAFCTAVAEWSSCRLDMVLGVSHSYLFFVLFAIVRIDKVHYPIYRTSEWWRRPWSFKYLKFIEMGELLCYVAYSQLSQKRLTKTISTQFHVIE